MNKRFLPIFFMVFAIFVNIANANSIVIDDITQKSDITFKATELFDTSAHTISGSTITVTDATLKAEKSERPDSNGNYGDSDISLYSTRVTLHPWEETLYTYNHTLINNTVSVANSTLDATGNIYIVGGYIYDSGNHTLTGNAVSITDKSKLTGHYIGLYGASTTAHGRITLTNNTVSVADSTLTGGTSLIGARAFSFGNATYTFINNAVSIENSTLTTIGISLTGASAEGNGNHILTNNTVSITANSELNVTKNPSDSESNIALYGAKVRRSLGNHTLSNNSISIADSTVTNNGAIMFTNNSLYGAYVTENSNGNHTLTNNIVSIARSNLTLTSLSVSKQAYMGITGGRIERNGMGNHTLTNNIVSIVKSTITDSNTNNEPGSSSFRASLNLIGAYVEGNGKHTLTNNTVAITDSIITASGVGSSLNLIGGSVGDSGNQTLTNNTVAITDSTIKALGVGSSLNLIGGYVEGSGKHTLTNNAIILSGTVNVTSDGTITLSGGYIVNGSDGSSTGNTLVLDNTTVNLDAETNSEIRLAGSIIEGSGNATNNTVILSGIVDITSTENITLGGGIIIGGSGDDHTGNTLILDGATVNLNAGAGKTTIKNFENYVFAPTQEQINNNTMMLTADSLELDSNSKIFLNSMPKDSREIALNTTFSLFDIDTITGNFANLDSLALHQGLAYAYDLTTKIENGKLSAEINSALKIAPQSGVPATGKLASVTFINQGSNLVSDSAIRSAYTATANATNHAFVTQNEGASVLVAGKTQYPTLNSKWTSFSSMSGGYSSYNNDTIAGNGFSLLTGIAKSTKQGNLLYGTFVEYGRYNLSTNNNFTTYSVEGDGKSDYIGGGILGRFNLSRFSTDLSLRIGSSSIEHNSSEYQGYFNQNISYDTRSLYASAHLGMGYDWQIFKNGTLLTYGKYFYTYIGESDALLTGDQYSFDAINSHRANVGVRYAHAINKSISPFIGVAYEYEFDSHANSSINGVALNAQTLTGATGILDFGVNLTPFANIHFDADVEIYTGMRKGITGNLQVMIDF